MTKLTVKNMKEWVRSRRNTDDAAESTIQNDLAILQSAWKWAESEKMWFLPDVLDPVIRKKASGNL